MLTDDFILYSESREYALIRIDRYKVQSFLNFNPKKYETEEHPIILEIDELEASKISKDLQHNWMRRYLLEKKVFYKQSMQA